MDCGKACRTRGERPHRPIAGCSLCMDAARSCERSLACLIGFCRQVQLGSDGELLSALPEASSDVEHRTPKRRKRVARDHNFPQSKEEASRRAFARDLHGSPESLTNALTCSELDLGWDATRARGSESLSGERTRRRRVCATIARWKEACGGWGRSAARSAHSGRAQCFLPTCQCQRGMMPTRVGF